MSSTWGTGTERPGDLHLLSSTTGLGGLSVEMGSDSRGGTGAFGQFGSRVGVSAKGAVSPLSDAVSTSEVICNVHVGGIGAMAATSEVLLERGVVPEVEPLDRADGRADCNATVTRVVPLADGSDRVEGWVGSGATVGVGLVVDGLDWVEGPVGSGAKMVGAVPIVDGADRVGGFSGAGSVGVDEATSRATAVVVE